jgi:hypothetical protein
LITNAFRPVAKKAAPMSLVPADRIEQPSEQERREHDPVREWLACVALDAPDEVKNRESWRQIREPMELLPSDIP